MTGPWFKITFDPAAAVIVAVTVTHSFAQNQSGFVMPKPDPKDAVRCYTPPCRTEYHKMPETKQDDVDAMLTHDLIEVAEKLFAATQIRVSPEHADLMQEASRLMSRAAEKIQSLKEAAAAR